MSGRGGGGWDSGRKKSKSGRAGSNPRKKSTLGSAPPPVNGVAVGPQAGGPKQELLRKDITNRVYHGAGIHEATASPAVQGFIYDSVTHVMRTGHFASNDIGRISQLAKAMYDGEKGNRKPPISPPPVHNQTVIKSKPDANFKWMAASTAPSPSSSFNFNKDKGLNVSINEPPKPNLVPQPPAPEEYRATVAARFNRVNQDKAWTQHVEEDTAQWKMDQKMKANRRKLEQEKQNNILRAQMQESQRKKRDSKAMQRSDMQMLIAEQKIKDEEARRREMELKATSKQKRREIEDMMREKVKERDRALKQQKEDDRLYVESIIAEEKEKKALDQKKKALGRQELLNFLSENEKNQQLAKNYKQEQLHMDRRDTIARQAIMLEKELEEKNSLQRKDEKGKRMMERAAKIQADYDAKQMIRDQLQRQQEQRLADEIQRKEDHAKAGEAERVRIKEQHKEKIISNLEGQMQEKQRLKEEAARKDAAHRARVEEAIKLGTASDDLIRQKNAERKQIMMRTLENQMKDKQRRENSVGVPYKVGHDY